MKIRSQLKALSILLLLSASTTYPMAARFKSALAYFTDKLPSKETIVQKAVNVPWALDRALRSPQVQEIVGDASIILSRTKDLAKDPYAIGAAVALGSTAYAIKNGGPTFNAKFGGAGKWEGEQEQVPLSEKPEFRLEMEKLKKITANTAEIEAMKEAADQFAHELSNETQQKSVTFGKTTIRYIPNRKSPTSENNNVSALQESRQKSEIKMAQADTALTELDNNLMQWNNQLIKGQSLSLKPEPVAAVRSMTEQKNLLLDAVDRNDLKKVNEIIFVNRNISPIEKIDLIVCSEALTHATKYVDILLALQAALRQ